MVTIARPDRRAFSLIELLVVISIIAVLAGMVVVASNAISGGAKKTKTVSILGALRSGLEATFAERGVFASPAEHPLAGSLPTRPTFIRLATATAVDTTGVALRAPDLAQVMASRQSRVLLDDDILSDPRAPQLFGMPRYRLGVLGVPQATVTAYRKLPPTLSATQDPDNLTLFPDRLYLEAPTGVPAENKDHITQLLREAAIAELTTLGALHEPGTGYSVALAGGGIVTNVASGTGVGSATWKPDHVADGTIPSGPNAGATNWKPYRLPGMACYDAWGTEILYSIRAGNRMAVVSAGRDRCFRWDPGKDATLATPALAAAAVGDDKDGSIDNLSQAVGE